jgi:hypothetical protein
MTCCILESSDQDMDIGSCGVFCGYVSAENSHWRIPRCSHYMGMLPWCPPCADAVIGLVAFVRTFSGLVAFPGLVAVGVGVVVRLVVQPAEFNG